MPAYVPGRGLSGSAVEKLRARKTDQEGIADIPAQDSNEQWDRLLGGAAKKKLRCGVCTKPLSQEEQLKRCIVCEACSSDISRCERSHSELLERGKLVEDEMEKDLFYFCLRGLPLTAPVMAPVQTKSTERPISQAEVAASKEVVSAPRLERGVGIDGQNHMVPTGRIPLSVLSFNLLADCYVRVEGQPWNAFPHCADEVLSWEKRQPRIFELLQSMAADVICLQEVLMELRDDEWRLPSWTDDLPGYTAVAQGFKQKEWEGQAERNKRICGVKAPTGLATLFKNARFEEAAPSKHGSGSGLTLYLKCKDKAADKNAKLLEVSVGNIHLAGDPSKAAEHLKALSSLKKNLGKQDLRLICGDFNSECLPGSEVRSWLADEGFSDAPTGTSWAAPGDAQRLDHVFHTRSLEVLAASADLSAEEASTGLPCNSCPSDHALVAVLFGAAVRGRCPW